MADFAAKTRQPAGHAAARKRKPRALLSVAPTAIPAPMRSAVPPGGRPLPQDVRRLMESRFGVDFSRVLIHTDGHAQDRAHERDANAYTIGDHIVFGRGYFSPYGPHGLRLLAHELSHVVQQRRGGAVPAMGDAPGLESQADRAADAVVSGGGVQVSVAGGAAAGVMCDRSGRKRRDRDLDDSDHDEDSDSEHARRKADKARTVQEKHERRTAGKSPEQVLEEDAQHELRKMEEHAAGAGGNQRSPKRRDRKLRRFERKLKDAPGSQLDKNKRLGDFDERQRTPDGVSAQEDYVAGSKVLPGQRVRDENDNSIAHHTRPDFSATRRRKDGKLERVHFNLKANKVHEMSESQARAAAREILYQAVKNKAHLPGEERLIISFAHVPSKKIQEAIKHELFREHTPISEIRFGNDVHHNRDYNPEGGRQPLDVSAKDRRQRLAREKKAARQRQVAAERDAKRKQAEEKRTAAAAKRKQDAEDKAARRKQEAQAKTAQRKQEAEARAAKRKQEAEAKATKRKQEAEAKAAKRKQEAEAKAASRKAEAGARTAKSKRSKGKAEAALGAKAKAGTQATATAEQPQGEGRKRAGKPAKKAASKKATSKKAANKAPASRTAVKKAAPKKPAAKTGTAKAATPRVRIADVDTEAAATPRLRIADTDTPHAPKAPAGKRVEDFEAEAEARRDEQALREMEAEQEQEKALKGGQKRRAGSTPPPRTAPDKHPEGDDAQQAPGPGKPGAKKQAGPAPAQNKPLQPPQPAPAAPKAPAPKAAPPAEQKPAPKAPPQKQQPKQPVAPPSPPSAKRTPPPQPPVKKPGAPKPSPKPPSTQQKLSAAPPTQAPNTPKVPRKPSAGSGASSAAVQRRSFLNDQVQVSVQEHIGQAKPFRVITTITARAGGAFSGQGSRGDTGGSANLSATGSLSVSYSKWMTAEEKNAYLDSVSRGHGGGGAESTLIELVASGNQEAATQAIRSAKEKMGTRQQGEAGDTEELAAEGDVSAGAGVTRGKTGGFGVGGSAQVSSGQGVRVSRTLMADGRERYTVVLVDRSGLGVGGSLQYGAVGGGHHEQRDSAKRVEMSFLLDPNAGDYAQRKGEILQARSPTALQDIARNHPTLVQGSGKSTDKSRGGTTSFDILGFGIDMDQTGFYGEGEYQDQNGKVRTVQGGAGLGGSMKAGGFRLNPQSKTDSFQGWTDENNVGGGITQSENRDVDLTKTAQGLADAASHPVASAIAYANGKPVLKERVDTTGVNLTDDSFARISKLAEDPKAWLQAWDKRGVARGAAKEWEATRLAVLEAKGDRYKIQQAMAKWEEGDSGRSGDVERLSGGTGVAFDFPDEIAHEKPVYDQLMMTDIFQGPRQKAAEGKPQDAIAELETLNKRLRDLLQAVQVYAGKATDPAKFAEVQNRISGKQAEVRKEIYRLTPKPAHANQAPAEPVPAPPPDFIGPLSPAQEDAVKADRKEASEVIHTQVGICLSNRERENQAFAAVEDELDDFYVNRVFIFTKLNELKPMYQKWDEAIALLKGAYPKIGDPPTRADQFAPNRGRWNDLNSKALK